MEGDNEQLKQKALLLLRRERELFEMRTKHEQVTLWLRLTQLLPQLFDRGLPIEAIYQRLRKSLLTGLRLQRVIFFELGAGSIRSLAPIAAPLALLPDVAALLGGRASGLCNDPGAEPSLAALAAQVGLHRFIWSTIAVDEQPPILLVAGFDKATAAYQTAFDDSSAAHVENVAQHIQTLLGNLFLVQALEREKEGLERANRLLEHRDQELLATSEELRGTNERLELRVVERTNALAQRTRDMRLVLDNVDQALITVDADGLMAQERSARVDAWLGAYEGNPSFVDYVARVDAGFAASFAVGYEALREDFLPRALSLEQLPKRLVSDGRTLRFEYSLLLDGAAIVGLLIVISDVTDNMRQAQEEEEQTELLALFQGLMRDRNGFRIFTDEVERLIADLTGGPFDLDRTRRLLHTLKGNAAMVGANLVARHCHQAESELEEDPGVRPVETLERLRHRWATVKESLTTFVGDRGWSVVEIASDEIEALEAAVRGGVEADHVLSRLNLWRLEPVQVPLARTAQYARALVRRLGKGDVDVTFRDSTVRLDRQRWHGLWSALVQLVRNAIDHGIESPIDRRASGKGSPARLELSVDADGQQLTFEVRDDGRGVDWDRVRAVAATRGLPHRDPEQLVQALLSPGFSTRAEVSQTSGRGIGLSVVAEEARALGGSLSVLSPLTPNGGTRWRLSFPLSSLTASERASLREDRDQRPAPRAATTPTHVDAMPGNGGGGGAGLGASQVDAG